MLEYSDRIILKRALENLAGANAVVRFLSDHFRDKYNLQSGQQISPEGEIVSNSGLNEKEKLNGSLLNPSDTPDGTRRDTESPPMRDMPDSMAMLHGTTENN
jgi:hypothetical protein